MVYPQAQLNFIAAYFFTLGGLMPPSFLCPKSRLIQGLSKIKPRIEPFFICNN